MPDNQRADQLLLKMNPQMFITMPCDPVLLAMASSAYARPMYSAGQGDTMQIPSPFTRPNLAIMSSPPPECSPAAQYNPPAPCTLGLPTMAPSVLKATETPPLFDAYEAFVLAVASLSVGIFIGAKFGH